MENADHRFAGPVLISNIHIIDQISKIYFFSRTNGFKMKKNKQKMWDGSIFPFCAIECEKK